MFPCNDVVAEELFLQAIGWEDAGLSDSMSMTPSVCLPCTARSDNQAKDSADAAFFYNIYTGEIVKTLENVVNIKFRERHSRNVGKEAASNTDDPVCPTSHAAWVALKLIVGGGFGKELMPMSHFTQTQTETSDITDESGGGLSVMVEEIARLQQEVAMLAGDDSYDADDGQFMEETEDADAPHSIAKDPIGMLAMASLIKDSENGEIPREFDILSPSLLADADEASEDDADADEPKEDDVGARNRALSIASVFALTPKEIADEMSMPPSSLADLSGAGNGWWEYDPDDDRSDPSLERLYRFVGTRRGVSCVKG